MAAITISAHLGTLKLIFNKMSTQVSHHNGFRRMRYDDRSASPKGLMTDVNSKYRPFSSKNPIFVQQL
ncbi:unnamed protein product [Toxocara canis]|uniref:Ovule protein n=1 Tax=Toxocara canis TaxID=6265 RepID=A0A183VBC3_TOXCA|nr:unnamed protein product [Toxocara canis]